MGVKFISQLAVKPHAKTGIIKRLLHARVGGYEIPRSKKTIHASELTKEVEFCPRMYRLMDLHADIKDPARHVSTAEAMTYAEGHDKQARLNNEWLRDRMVGDWKCTSCGEVKRFQKAPAGGCDDPGQKCNWVYQEVRIEDPITGASGGLDGLVIVSENAKLRLLECKILDKDYFKAQKGPYAEHRTRTQLYLRMIAKSKQPWAKQIETSEASVLYMMRGFGAKDEAGDMTPLREYTVERDDKAVQVYAAKAHAVTLSRREPDRGLPCGLCKHMMTDRARTCPAVKQCFSPKNPQTITWIEGGKPRHDLPSITTIVDGVKVHDAQAGK